MIKGSEQALNSEQGYLDQETYSGIRRRSHATSDEQRELIYRIFEAYTKRKKEYGQYDAADRYVVLWECLRGSEVLTLGCFRTRMLLKCLDSVRLPRDILPKFMYAFTHWNVYPPSDAPSVMSTKRRITSSLTL